MSCANERRRALNPSTPRLCQDSGRSPCENSATKRTILLTLSIRETLVLQFVLALHASGSIVGAVVKGGAFSWILSYGGGYSKVRLLKVTRRQGNFSKICALYFCGRSLNISAFVSLFGIFF